MDQDYSAAGAKANWDDRYGDSDYVWTVEPNGFVSQHLSDLKPGADLEPGVAIDLGGGEGRNGVWLATLGWKVTVVDISPVGLEKAHQLAASVEQTVETVEADASEWAPAEPVDLVVLSYLQLPTSVRVPLLERVGTWLKPGGVVFVVAHDLSNLESGHGGPPMPDVLYTVEETVAAFTDGAGLQIRVAEVAPRTVALKEPDADGRTEATALDTVVLAVR